MLPSPVEACIHECFESMIWARPDCKLWPLGPELLIHEVERSDVACAPAMVVSLGDFGPKVIGLSGEEGVPHTIKAASHDTQEAACSVEEMPVLTFICPEHF